MQNCTYDYNNDDDNHNIFKKTWFFMSKLPIYLLYN